MKMFLADSWVSRSRVIEVRNPEDSSLIDTVPVASGDDIEVALECAAGQGAVASRELSGWQRSSILKGVAYMLRRDAESLAQLIATEGVKTIREARREVARAADTFSFCAEEVRRLGGESLSFDHQTHGEGKVGYCVRDPVGVVFAVTPFNDPLNLVAHKLGPAIATGNSVILKPHSSTPLSALRLAKYFQEAGLPGGILQVITGRGKDLVPAIAADPRVRLLSFTGGIATGRNIARAAGLKKLSMELGSNAATIILSDANLDAAIPDCVSGAFWAAGQNCLHVQRLIVHHEVYEEVRERFVGGAKSLRVGKKMDDRTDMGPLIDEEAAGRVASRVAEAVRSGGRLLCGGEVAGSFLQPTVLEAVGRQDFLCKEEIYGPVTVLQRVESLDEAIDVANDTNYGLQSAIFTENIGAAFHATRHLQTGTVIVNGSTDFRVDTMPFGGMKQSGIGREGVSSAMLEMTEPKVICLNVGTALDSNRKEAVRNVQ